jgi:hypothetical protein
MSARDKFAPNTRLAIISKELNSRATNPSFRNFLTSVDLEVNVWDPKEAAKISRFFTYANDDTLRY